MKTVLRLGALAVLFAAGLAMFSPGGVREPLSVNAYACGVGNTGTLEIEIIDVLTGTQVTIAGTAVSITPNPTTGLGTMLARDDLQNDDANPDPGFITETAACSTVAAETYSAQVITPPSGCTPVAGSPPTSALPVGGTATMQLFVDCSEEEQVPTDILPVASPQVLRCGGESTLTATLFDQNAQEITGVIFGFVTDSGSIDTGVGGAGPVVLTLEPGEPDANVTISAGGVSRTITVENDCAPLSLFASPMYLPCGGGTTTLTAVLRDGEGDVVPDVIFTWSVTPGVSLDVGPPNSPAAVDGTAVLFIPSATRQATVTVQAGGDSESIVIQQVCGKVAIAITADPNVIPCGGTTNLTATARDDNGHIDLGLGFHWETDIGQLYVGPPNTADQVDNRATLTLVPGMNSATVKAWVGNLSDFPGFVTVQQFCPGVTTDGSSASGSIQLSASTVVAGCGEAIFIGARVRDSKNQVPPADTAVRFIASAGAFQVDAGVTTTYGGANADQSLTTVSQYNGATDGNGVMNLTYLAPLYGGDAQITAASGDKFAKLTIKVNCAAPPPAVVSGTSGSSQAPCTPIGDGVCIRPPSTGIRITPPSTGDAGLK